MSALGIVLVLIGTNFILASIGDALWRIAAALEREQGQTDGGKS